MSTLSHVLSFDFDKLRLFLIILFLSCNSEIREDVLRISISINSEEGKRDKISMAVSRRLTTFQMLFKQRVSQIVRQEVCTLTDILQAFNDNLHSIIDRHSSGK